VHWLSARNPLLPVQQFDVLTMLGFVILIGVVVNNAILIIHQALNYIRDEGMEPNAAVAQSVRTRVRPIFMTAMTSVFGTLPLVIAPGSGSELYRGLGAVTVGGLLVSTLFTLVVVPAMFSLFIDIRRTFRHEMHVSEKIAPTHENFDEPLVETTSAGR
jgi:HAE1 family hydrophobic/amphiphilic exporter-1